MTYHIRFKPPATASDMTEILRYCRSRGWRVVPLGAFGRRGWLIFTRKLS